MKNSTGFKENIKFVLRQTAFYLFTCGVCYGCFYLGAYDANNKWRKELIKRDLAEYDSKTGEWKYSLVYKSDLFGHDPLAELDNKLEGPMPTKKEVKRKL